MEKEPGLEKRKEKIEKFIKEFSFLKDNYIDDLPEEIITPLDKNYYKYKCRTSWWNGILNKMSLLSLSVPVLKDKTREEMVNFSTYIESVDYSKLRTKEEIEKANNQLEKIIGLLKEEK